MTAIPTVVPTWERLAFFDGCGCPLLHPVLIVGVPPTGADTLAVIHAQATDAEHGYANALCDYYGEQENENDPACAGPWIETTVFALQPATNPRPVLRLPVSLTQLLGANGGYETDPLIDTPFVSVAYVPDTHHVPLNGRFDQPIQALFSYRILERVIALALRTHLAPAVRRHMDAAEHLADDDTDDLTEPRDPHHPAAAAGITDGSTAATELAQSLRGMFDPPPPADPDPNNPTDRHALLWTALATRANRLPPHPAEKLIQQAAADPGPNGQQTTAGLLRALQTARELYDNLNLPTPEPPTGLPAGARAAIDLDLLLGPAANTNQPNTPTAVLDTLTATGWLLATVAHHTPPGRTAAGLACRAVAPLDQNRDAWTRTISDHTLDPAFAVTLLTGLILEQPDTPQTARDLDQFALAVARIAQRATNNTPAQLPDSTTPDSTYPPGNAGLRLLHATTGTPITDLTHEHNRQHAATALAAATVIAAHLHATKNRTLPTDSMTSLLTRWAYLTTAFLDHAEDTP